MSWKKHYKIRPSDADYALMEELAIAEFHALPTLQALFGRKGSTYLERRLTRLVERGYLGRIALDDRKDFGKYAYFLGAKGIEAVSCDAKDHVRLTRILQRGDDRSLGRMRHDLYRAKVRAYLLRDPTLRLDRWIQRREAVAVGEVDGEVKTVEPDCLFFSRRGGEELCVALEVDLATYAVQRSSLDQGSSILEKLLVYESLYESDSKGRRFRIEHWGASCFRPVFFKPATHATNPKLGSQRFRNCRRLIKRYRLKALRRTILFADDAWQTHGEEFQVEDYWSRRFGLSDREGRRNGGA